MRHWSLTRTLASDSSASLSTDYGLMPSRGCLPLTICDRPTLRPPGFRAESHRARAELFDPGESGRPTSTLDGLPASSSHTQKRVDTPIYSFFRGSIARPTHLPSYASPRGSPHAAQGMASWGWTPSGAGFALASGANRALTCISLPACAGARWPTHWCVSCAPHAFQVDSTFCASA